MQRMRIMAAAYRKALADAIVAHGYLQRCRFRQIRAKTRLTTHRRGWMAKPNRPRRPRSGFRTVPEAGRRHDVEAAGPGLRQADVQRRHQLAGVQLALDQRPRHQGDAPAQQRRLDGVQGAAEADAATIRGRIGQLGDLLDCLG